MELLSDDDTVITTKIHMYHPNSNASGSGVNEAYERVDFVAGMRFPDAFFFVFVLSLFVRGRCSITVFADVTHLSVEFQTL